MTTESKTRWTQAEALREINRISDQFAFSRYTVAEAAARDGELGCLIECFLNDEPDMETGRKVTKQYLKRKLRDFNRRWSHTNSELTFLKENGLVPQDTRMGQVYYEKISQEKA
jgi:hypothetical protein